VEPPHDDDQWTVGAVAQIYIAHAWQQSRR
jgi:hypothetical protein